VARVSTPAGSWTGERSGIAKKKERRLGRWHRERRMTGSCLRQWTSARTVRMGQRDVAEAHTR